MAPGQVASEHGAQGLLELVGTPQRATVAA